jgi:predicted nucleotidyltransferase
MKDFQKLLPEDYVLLYVTQSGSKLYGTDTSTSDTDYMGLYVPSKYALYTNTWLDEVKSDTSNSKQKNTKEDVDCSLKFVCTVW